VNAVNIIPRISINDDAGPASGPAHGPVAQPVGRGRLSERRDRMADAHLKRHGPPSETVVVAVTNGRLDGFALLTRTFGTWERIFYDEFDGRRRKRVLVKIIGD